MVTGMIGSGGRKGAVRHDERIWVQYEGMMEKRIGKICLMDKMREVRQKKKRWAEKVRSTVDR